MYSPEDQDKILADKERIIAGQQDALHTLCQEIVNAATSVGYKTKSRANEVLTTNSASGDPQCIPTPALALLEALLLDVSHDPNLINAHSGLITRVAEIIGISSSSTDEIPITLFYKHVAKCMRAESWFVDALDQAMDPDQIYVHTVLAAYCRNGQPVFLQKYIDQPTAIAMRPLVAVGDDGTQLHIPAGVIVALDYMPEAKIQVHKTKTGAVLEVFEMGTHVPAVSLGRLAWCGLNGTSNAALFAAYSENFVDISRANDLAGHTLKDFDEAARNIMRLCCEPSSVNT